MIKSYNTAVLYSIIYILVIRGQFDYQIKVIRLNLCLMRGFVSDNRPALLTSMNYNVSALGIRLSARRAQYTSALVCSIPRVHVNVKRAKAKRAMIPRGVSERKHLTIAICAHKSVIIL